MEIVNQVIYKFGVFSDDCEFILLSQHYKYVTMLYDISDIFISDESIIYDYCFNRIEPIESLFPLKISRLV